MIWCVPFSVCVCTSEHVHAGDINLHLIEVVSFKIVKVRKHKIETVLYWGLSEVLIFWKAPLGFS